ncbi:hypothetical protein [Roseivirga sp.]|uniref:hypothetical protein n=1 Tax=Roseivirga sp. TaxID=1964215 RepID=UPI003B8B40CA
MKKAKYQRFDVAPRYYDPIKEDIENRTSRIKAELGMLDDDSDLGYGSQISGSFRKNMKHAKGNGVGQTAMLRLVIMIVLVMFAGGFVYIGSDIFYLALLYIPFYLWKKFKS